MKFDVWYLNDYIETAYFNDYQKKFGIDAGDYKKVTSIDAVDLDDLYECMQDLEPEIIGYTIDYIMDNYYLGSTGFPTRSPTTSVKYADQLRPMSDGDIAIDSDGIGYVRKNYEWVKFNATEKGFTFKWPSFLK